MKKRNLKDLRLNKKSIAAFKHEVKGAIHDIRNRTKSALPLCPGCYSIPGMNPECDLMEEQ